MMRYSKRHKAVYSILESTLTRSQGRSFLRRVKQLISLISLMKKSKTFTTIMAMFQCHRQ